MKKVTRATLARVIEEQPHDLYKALFYNLIARCQAVAPKNRFRLKDIKKVYLLDATTISLCLKVFPWATFRRKKGAVKLHIDGYLTEFIDATEGKKHEISWAKKLKLPSGSLIVFDRGYTDYDWYQALMDSGIFFVARLKDNALLEYLNRQISRQTLNWHYFRSYEAAVFFYLINYSIYDNSF